MSHLKERKGAAVLLNNVIILMGQTLYMFFLRVVFLLFSSFILNSCYDLSSCQLGLPVTPPTGQLQHGICIGRVAPWQ